jgi:serine/threonine protein kinase
MSVTETLDDADSSTRGAFNPRLSRLPPLEDARFPPGRIFASRYRIVSLLGRGGMGEVYRADDLKLGQRVALKLLWAGQGAPSPLLHHLIAEVRLARDISHPNVCRVYDIGEAEGWHYLSMEYVDGETLASLLRRIGRLPTEKALDVARQLCAGLAAAHERGVLHRDLKPANIMVDGRGQIRIVDLGLATPAADPGREVAGTPAYMAPEQLTGGRISERTDLYALGLVLYELFTGRMLFAVGTMEERVLAGSSGPVALARMAGIDPDIEDAIRGCLELDPADRPSSAWAVAAALPGGDPLTTALAEGRMPSPALCRCRRASGIGGDRLLPVDCGAGRRKRRRRALLAHAQDVSRRGVGTIHTLVNRLTISAIEASARASISAFV